MILNRILSVIAVITIGSAARGQVPNQGSALFSSSCAGCHGLDGRGGEHAPDIATRPRIQQLSNPDLAQIVHDGIPSAGMPSFGALLTDRQIITVIQYLRSLQGLEKSVSPPGDPVKGRDIFFGSGGCSQCHTMHGKGGFLGADLTYYGETHTAAQIRQSIIDPPRDSEDGQDVIVVTRQGQQFTGIARNEDNFSLQLQTPDGVFHLLDKANLSRVSHTSQSLMPRSYGTALRSGELEDLVSYILQPERGDSAQSRHTFQLAARSPEFWKLIPHDAKLTTVATGFGFTEGPVWDPSGFLYVSDELQNKIYRVYLDGRKEPLISLGDPDGNAFDAQRRLIDCASVLRAIIRIDKSGEYKILASRFEGHRFNSPNDVVLGPDGTLYFTDPTLDLPKGEKQEIDFKGVYRLDNTCNVQLLSKDMSQPNGLAFSPDGKRFYIMIVSRKTSEYWISPTAP